MWQPLSTAAVAAGGGGGGAVGGDDADVVAWNRLALARSSSRS